MLDGRAILPSPGRAYLYLLGLLSKRLWPECGFAHRPYAAEPGSGRSVGRRAGRCRGSGLGQEQRSCPGLGRTLRREETVEALRSKAAREPRPQLIRRQPTCSTDSAPAGRGAINELAGIDGLSQPPQAERSRMTIWWS